MDESSNAEEDLVRSFMEAVTDGGMVETVIPNLHTGAEVDETSIKVRVADPYVDMKGSEITVAGIVANEVEFATLDFPTGITIGDFVTVISNPDAGDPAVVATRHLVTAVLEDTYKIRLNRVVPATDNPTLVWLRSVPGFTLPYDDTAITFNTEDATVTLAPLTRPVSGVDKTVYEANAYCGYRALRKDTDTLQSANSLTVLESILGTATPENPLAYGAMIALANSQSMIYFIGVDSDDLSGYTKAKDILENAEDIYSIVPLNRDVGVLSMFKTHAEAFSQPQIGEWRIVFGNSELPNLVTLEEGTCRISETPSTDLKVVTASGASFIGSGVNSGDIIILSNNTGTTTEYTVSSIVSEDQLLVSEEITDMTADLVDYTFEIQTVPDKTQQAQAIAGVSRSFASSRFYHVWPDTVEIDGQQLPGYYMCCAIGGMVSSLPSHQGLTRISVAGITAVKNSGDYFNNAQMNIIADGGTLIVEQLFINSAPYIRHQLSTDTSEYTQSELSFVKNFDYVSYLCKDVLDGFVGRYNITPATLTTLGTVLSAVLESLKLSSLPKIGSPILQYEPPVINQLEGQKDRVEINVRVELPYVLNLIGLHLISSDM
jgi:hypothetical protein